MSAGAAKSDIELSGWCQKHGEKQSSFSDLSYEHLEVKNFKPNMLGSKTCLSQKQTQ
jgi:hypothetical protein